MAVYQILGIFIQVLKVCWPMKLPIPLLRKVFSTLNVTGLQTLNVLGFHFFKSTVKN